ncbi:hypothetical protein DPMN_036017 [Dreissena polymorpha]|uniref:Uncharacterized protein n=1 Tax=Dreissena polymorpha TaxID=45954 RepID=A0A9D4MAN8_DREPO|nr:hypothetical protein DPMN_155091 [Dreissena polymorpha]KAH3872794.1 hypothetical protein DPMN_036017 [Dreissena polymorpha]
MLLGFDILINPGRAIINMAGATIIFDGQVLNHERGGPQHTMDVHDAVPLVLPTVPDVVRDPGMVIGESTEGDNGDCGCDDEFRVQRVAVQSGDRATPTARHADPVGVTAEDSRGKASGCCITATDRRCRASGYDVSLEDRRKCATGYEVAAGGCRRGGASGYRVAPVESRKDEGRRPLRRGSQGWRPSSSRRWERSQR